MCNVTIVLQTCRPTCTDKNMAACFSRVCGAAKALEALVTMSVSIISQILEQKLWPFNVKGVDMSDALQSTRGQTICPNLFVDGGQPLQICLQGLCPQSSISCGAELLTARHLICASKRCFRCQICTIL